MSDIELINCLNEFETQVKEYDDCIIIGVFQKGEKI